jgi:LysM repeat protein
MPGRLVGALLLWISLAACADGAVAPEENGERVPEVLLDSAAVAAPQEEPDVVVFLPDGDDRTVSQRLEDTSLSARVRIALMNEPGLRPLDIHPTVVGGYVLLAADSMTEAQRALAIRVTGTVSGVRGVVDRLETVPLPPPLPPEALTGEEDVEAPPPVASGDVFHTVRSGESLWIIARAHNVTIEQLRQINGLRSDQVRPGQRLRIR